MPQKGALSKYMESYQGYVIIDSDNRESRGNLHCNDVLKKGKKIVEELKSNMHKLKSNSTRALR